MVVYMRTANPDNRNLYVTTADTAVSSTQGYCMERGSPTIYPCAQLSAFVQKFTKGTNLFETDSDLAFTAGDVIFINNQGPLLVTQTTAATSRQLYCEHAGVAGNDLFETFDGSTDTKWPIWKVASEADGIARGDILTFHGRKYKVNNVHSPPVLTGDRGILTGVALTGTGLTMSEAVAAGHMFQVCEKCVTDLAATSITTDKHVTLAVGEQLMVSGRARKELLFSVHTAMSDAMGAITVSKGGLTGSPLEIDPDTVLCHTGTTRSQLTTPTGTSCTTTTQTGLTVSERARVIEQERERERQREREGGRERERERERERGSERVK
jgi:hypothetical protein